MYYKRFAVDGVENDTVLDDGLVSLVIEKKRINAILIHCTEYQNNVIEGWIGTERILEIPDVVIDTYDGSPQNLRSTTKMIRIPIEMDIPEGQIFKIGLRCGAAATNIRGSYEYEVAK